MNLGSSVLEAFSEGATLGVVFLAVEVLSAPANTPFDWSNMPLVGKVPEAVGLLSQLPATSLFISLLVLAVLLQIIQSLTQYINLTSIGYFSARCRTLVTARIHAQVLSSAFPVAVAIKLETSPITPVTGLERSVSGSN